MFNFNFNWDWTGWNLDALNEPAPVLDNTWLAQVEREIAALSTVVTEAVVNSPAVIEAPVNREPEIARVEQAVQQVVQAVAPVVAPSLPDYILQLTTPLFVDEIAYSPEVISAPVGQTVPPKAVETIVENIVNTAVKDETFVNSVAASIPDSIIKRLPPELREDIADTVSQAIETVAQAPDMPDTFATYASFRQKEIADEYGIQTALPPVAPQIPLPKNEPAPQVEPPKLKAVYDGDMISYVEDTSATTSDLVYRGGASVTPDLVYRGGAEEQKLPYTPTPTPTPTPTVTPTATSTATTAANVTPTAPQNFTGDGTQTRPLLLNGQRFTGNRNGIEYKDGLPVDATRADILQADREARMAAEAAARAASNPLYNFAIRPTAKPADENYIYYYSWIGGVNTGQWEEYRAPNTPENRAKYGSRGVGGATQASGAADAKDANTLVNQPTVTPEGVITNPGAGNTVPGPGTGAITSGVTTGVTTGGVTTGVTTGGVTTGVTTGGVTTGVTTSAVTTGPTTTPVFPTFPTTTPTTTAPTTTTPTTTAPAFDINRQSAIKSLQDRFAKYGLSSLANKILELAQDGATEATITLQLQETPEYQQRFSANQERLKKGLTVLTPAEYLNLEDGYRQVLRAYGLRQFDNDDYVQQFISNDVSPAELSNRVVTAVQRVQNADPQIARTLRDYYGIGQNDLVAYVLDPQQQFQKIERQVAAAEIGTAARVQGIEPGVGTAEALAAQGITQAEARRGYSTIADILPTAEKLSQIYAGTEQAYGLAEAEQEVFNSLAEAQRRRQRLTQREVAAFSGQTGLGRTSLTQQTGGRF